MQCFKQRHKFSLLRRLNVMLSMSEGRQYAAFLVSWYFLQAAQSIARTLTFCLTFVVFWADEQELAPENLSLILKISFSSCLVYIVLSGLLFLCLPASLLMKGLQEKLQQHRQSLRRMAAAERAVEDAALSCKPGASAQLRNNWTVKLQHFFQQILHEKFRELWSLRRRRLRGNLELQLGLWLQLPLRGLLYLVEIALALVCGGLAYFWAWAQGASILS